MLNKRLDAMIQNLRTAVWPAYIGCLWAILYAVFVRFYQSAGGTIGIQGEFIDPQEFRMSSYGAGVFILFCGFILIALVKPWTKVVPEWVPLIGGKYVPRLIIIIPTLLCSAFAIAHGISGIITKILLLAEVITIKFPYWKELDVRRLAILDIFVYEPWFVIMGVLSSLTAAHYALASDVSLPVVRRCIFIFLGILFLVTAQFVYAIIYDL